MDDEIRSIQMLELTSKLLESGKIDALALDGTEVRSLMLFVLVIMTDLVFFYSQLTALNLASKHGNLPILKALLKIVPNQHLFFEKVIKIFHFTSKKNILITFLISLFLQEENKGTPYPLIDAIEGGHLEAVKCLIEKGGFSTEIGRPLYTCILNNTEKILLPIHVAILHGHRDIVRYLWGHLKMEPSYYAIARVRFAGGVLCDGDDDSEDNYMDEDEDDDSGDEDDMDEEDRSGDEDDMDEEDGSGDEDDMDEDEDDGSSEDEDDGEDEEYIIEKDSNGHKRKTSIDYVSYSFKTTNTSLHYNENSNIYNIHLHTL